MGPQETPASACALCGKAVGGDEPAHAVRDKVICEECRRLVSASGPRQVLPYAGHGARRRRWLWPAIAAAVVVAALLSSLFLTARHAAVERARAAEMRALAAQQRALAEVVAAAADQARRAATQPAR